MAGLFSNPLNWQLTDSLQGQSGGINPVKAVAKYTIPGVYVADAAKDYAQKPKVSPASESGFSETGSSGGGGGGGGGTGIVLPPASTTNTRTTGTGIGTGDTTPAKVLDTAELASLDAYLARLATDREQAIAKATLARDAALAEKKAELEREKTKYEGSKLSTLQDFSGALTDTTLNTRNTLENLMSALSTLGLGGSRALTRQLMDAANMSNRKANATQATDTRNLDSSFNEFSTANTDDVTKIGDQYKHDEGEANRNYYTGQQNTYYKKGDVYGAADKTGEKAAMLKQGDDLTSFITGSTFLNPQYKGTSRAMDMPELGDYTQNIAKYDTVGIGAGGGSPMTPAGKGVPGNLAIKGMAVNDKDLGIKKKTENDLGYGV